MLAVSGAIKELEAIKSFGSLLALFTSLLHSSDRKRKAWLFKKKLEETIRWSLLR
jgi:hypothetical protein